MGNEIVIFDLETFGFDFSADKGFVLCGSIKSLGEDKIETIVNKNGWDDKEAVGKLGDILSKSRGFITQNGKRFDVRFLNTRLLFHRLPPLPASTRHFDTQEIMWKKLKMRTSLDSAQKFFGLPTSKTPVTIQTWTKAAFGDPKAMREVVVHCERDVRATEELYYRIRSLGGYQWNFGSIYDSPGGTCFHCGSSKAQRRGWAYALTTKSRRYQCQSCYGWFLGQKEKIVPSEEPLGKSKR